jgi:hypothetical protein
VPNSTCSDLRRERAGGRPLERAGALEAPAVAFPAPGQELSQVRAELRPGSADLGLDGTRADRESPPFFRAQDPGGSGVARARDARTPWVSCVCVIHEHACTRRMRYVEDSSFATWLHFEDVFAQVGRMQRVLRTRLRTAEMSPQVCHVCCRWLHVP